jgi:hypothetical protein
MALKGTLADLDVVVLLQVPSTGGKTGELVIVPPAGDEGHVFYAEGRLIHAQVGAATGVDALVEVVDWSQGEFEFRLDVPSPQTTIDMDLARAVMLALKMRDERRAAEQERQARRDAPGNGHGRTASALQQTLEQFVSATPFALQACVLRPDGTSVAEAADQARPVEAADLLRSSLCALAAAYPRDGLRRIVVDDSAGTGCLVPVGSEGFLLVLATKEASLGALTVAAGRLAATAL